MDQAEKLKLTYGASLASTAVAAAWMSLCEVPALFAHGMPALLVSIQVFAVFCFGIVAVPLWLLSRKPRWWGKLLLLACGISWIAHGAALAAILPLWHAHVASLWTPVACGLIMLALALAHQLVDPRFSTARS